MIKWFGAWIYAIIALIESTVNFDELFEASIICLFNICWKTACWKLSTF